MRIFFLRHPQKSQEKMTAILLWLSFPSVVVGNLLFVVVVLLRNDRSRIKTLRDDDKKQYNKSVIKMGVILNLFQNLHFG